MKLKVLFKDTATGKDERYEAGEYTQEQVDNYVHQFFFEDHNRACDCNRGTVFWLDLPCSSPDNQRIELIEYLFYDLPWTDKND